MSFWSMDLILLLSFAFNGYFLMQHFKLFTDFPLLYISLALCHCKRLTLSQSTWNLHKFLWDTDTLLLYRSILVSLFASYCHIYSKSIKGNPINILLSLLYYIKCYVMKSWYKAGYQVSIYRFCYIHLLCHDFWCFAYVCMDLTPSRVVSLPNTASLPTTSFVLLLQIYYIPYVVGPTNIGLL